MGLGGKGGRGVRGWVGGFFSPELRGLVPLKWSRTEELQRHIDGDGMKGGGGDNKIIKNTKKKKKKK